MRESGVSSGMPLDAGAYDEGFATGRPSSPAARPRLTLDPAVDIGAALRTARQDQGLSLSDIAEATRVREAHLAAIEAGRMDLLPARPFTIGYVRAYAKALGVDADATASRFRTEYPSPDDALHNPVGVKHARPKRSPWLAALAAGAAVAVVGWNVSRHIEIGHANAAVARAHAPAPPHANTAPAGPFTADTPLPAPPEATAPAPYITPVVGANAAEAVNAAPAQPAAGAAPTPFVAQGAVYGPTKGASALIIQAKKSISLEVRGPGGAVYFARQLAAGEAYRVPALPGLTAEVSNPASAELYEGGVSKGLFTAAQMPLKTVG